VHDVPASPRGLITASLAGRVRVGRPLSRRGDAALVRSAQGGSAEAVEELFRRHWPAVHRSAWLVVHDAAAAQDIAQEAFVSALRALDRFDRRRPLAPWLHRIVVNRAIDWARARALRPETGADTLPEPAAPAASHELGDELVAALADLRPEHRAVVVLRHLLGYTPGEIPRVVAGRPLAARRRRYDSGSGAAWSPRVGSALSDAGVAALVSAAR
jgi:RNA polymerase sigma-70 factor (ECF subfamily)